MPLIEWGFARYTAKTVAVGGQRAGWINTRLGAEGRVAAMTAQSVHVTQDRLHPQKIETELLPTQNTAPIQQGQEVGVLVVKRGGKQVARVPVLATQAIPKSVARATGRSPWLWITVLGSGGALFVLRQRQLAQARARKRRRRRAVAAQPYPEDPSTISRNYSSPREQGPR